MKQRLLTRTYNRHDSNISNTKAIKLKVTDKGSINYIYLSA